MKKRFFAVALALVMTVMCFAGCGESSVDLSGTWKCQRDYTEQMNTSFAQGLGSMADDITKYIQFSDFVLIMELEITSDGMMRITLDEDALRAQVEKNQEIIATGLKTYFTEMITDAGLDMSVDEYLESAGVDIDAIAEEAMGESFIAAQKASTEKSNRYTIEGDKLYSYADGSVANPDYYETFTLEGDTLTFTSASFDLEVDVYPVVFTRVK